MWLLATHDMRPAVLACERAESDRAELDAKTKKLAEVEERYRRVSEKLRSSRELMQELMSQKTGSSESDV